MPRLIKVAANAYLHKREPISLVHWVTHRCNARCRHCFIDFDAPGAYANPLTLQEIETLTRHLGGSLVNVNLAGGEPFLRKDLWPICRAYFDNAGVSSVYISTHGGYPERVRALLEAFAASGIKGELFLSISVDDFAEGHDQNRRVPGLFARALETYRLVRDYGRPNILANVAITVTAHNHARVAALYDHLRDEGVEMMTAIAQREQGVSGPLSATAKAQIGAAYAALTRRIEHDLATRTASGYGESPIGRVINAKDRLLYGMLRQDGLEEGRYRSPCPAGGLFAVLQADGGVRACEVLDDGDLGNLRDHGYDLQALLAAPAAQKMRRRIRRSRCHCSYECALAVNIVSNLRYAPGLAWSLVKGY